MKTKVLPVLEDSGSNVLMPFEVTCQNKLCQAVLEIDAVEDVKYVRVMSRLDDSYGWGLVTCGFKVTCPHCEEDTWLEKHNGELPSTKTTTRRPYPGLEEWHRAAAQSAAFNQ
jgi:hypothetical protein